MEMIVLVGIPGSGKTTLALNSYPNHHRINLDRLHTRKKEDEEISNSIANGQDIIIDNTNTTIRSRSKYIEAARLFGISIRAIYLKCSLATALERNTFRQGKERVPENAVRYYNKILQPPTLEEGFDRIDELVIRV
jgi:predicted kinase